MLGGSDDEGGFIRRPLLASNECVLFLSSGNDILAERDHFGEIVTVFNDQLHWAKWRQGRFLMRVVRWEQDAPHRTQGDPNRAFRNEAVASHTTVVLLHDDIRPGTKDELEAALQDEDVQISVIWMEPNHPQRRATLALNRYLKSKDQQVIWEKTGPPGSRAATLSMVKVVARVWADLTNPSNQSLNKGPVHFEDR